MHVHMCTRAAFQGLLMCSNSGRMKELFSHLLTRVSEVTLKHELERPLFMLGSV